MRVRRKDEIRFILSGEVREDLALRSTLVAHQCLSKPCRTEWLEKRLSVALFRRDAVVDQASRTMAAHLLEVPALPRHHDDLEAALGRGDVSVEKIGEIIECDLGMSARVLQLANSAFIAEGGEVSSVQRAVAQIGIDTIRSLMSSGRVFTTADSRSVEGAHLVSLSDRSRVVALRAREIALAGGKSKAEAERAYAGALLGSIGKAVFLCEAPSDYIRILESNRGEPYATMELELATFGCTHAQLGAYLLSMWGLPEDIVGVVARQDDSEQVRGTQSSPAIPFSERTVTCLASSGA